MLLFSLSVYWYWLNVTRTLTAEDSSSAEPLIAVVFSLSSVSLLCERPSRLGCVLRYFAASNSAAENAPAAGNQTLQH